MSTDVTGHGCASRMCTNCRMFATDETAETCTTCEACGMLMPRDPTHTRVLGAAGMRFVPLPQPVEVNASRGFNGAWRVFGGPWWTLDWTVSALGQRCSLYAEANKARHELPAAAFREWAATLVALASACDAADAAIVAHATRSADREVT